MPDGLSVDGLSVIRRVYGLDATAPPASGAAATGAALEEAAEEALLRQSRAALDALPRVAPPPAVLQAVEAEAARAADPSLGAVRFVYGLGEEPAGAAAEVALLRQSRAAVETLPPASPPAARVEAVEGRAAEASVAPVLAAYGEASPLAEAASPEVAVLRQSRAALDALPRHEPSEAAMAAVLAAAATASGGASTPTHTPAADRPPVAGARTRRRTGAFAGVATLAVAVFAAVLMLRPDAPTLQADLTADAPAPQADPAPLAETPPADPAPAPPIATAPEPSAPLVAAAPTPAPARRLPGLPPTARVPSGPAASAPAPRTVSRSVPRAAAPPPAEAQLVAERAVLDDAEAAPAPETDWEAGEDVRLLSLRLQKLRQQNKGLEWDTPSVAFGDSDPTVTGGATPGIQAVRAGAAPAARPPARARVRADRVRTDSALTRTDR